MSKTILAIPSQMPGGMDSGMGFDCISTCSAILLFRSNSVILITFSPLTWSVFVLNTLWNLFAFFSQILRKFFSFIVLFVKIYFVSVLYHDILFS